MSSILPRDARSDMLGNNNTTIALYGTDFRSITDETPEVDDYTAVFLSHITYSCATLTIVTNINTHNQLWTYAGGHYKFCDQQGKVVVVFDFVLYAPRQCDASHLYRSFCRIL